MKYFAACIALLAAASLQAGEPFNNETIVKLVNSGLEEDAIVAIVNQQPGKYELTPDNITSLKNDGVSEKVLAAMTAQNRTGETSPNSARRVKSPNSVLPREHSTVVGGKTHVYLTDSKSWETRGGFNGTSDSSSADSTNAIAHRSDVLQAFQEQCSDLVVTNDVDKADYAIALDQKAGKPYIHKNNKVVVYDRQGDPIFADSTRVLGNTVKDSCTAIVSYAAAHREDATPAQAAAHGMFEMTFTSSPANALVTIYGQPIGRTPFTSKLQAGIYQAVFTVPGYPSVKQDIAVGPGFTTNVNTTIQTTR